MNRGRASAILAAFSVLLACGDERPPPSPARFDRPNGVAFVCVQNDEAVQLAHCRDDVRGDPLALYALVTQSARGEIAAINLETRRVLDSRRDIPGYTFVPVGEGPVALVVPPRRAQHAYVADYGSRDIRVLDTNALVGPLAGDPTLQIVRLQVDLPSGAEIAAPTDMVLSPDEDALIVAAPAVSRVFYLPLQRCAGRVQPDCSEGLIDETRIVEIPLESSRDRLIMSPAPSAPPTEASYELLCGFSRTPPSEQPPPELPPEVLARTPKPTALAVDADCPTGTACSPRVLVADEALPIVHALDLDVLASTGDAASAVLDPLFAGAPTRRVAVTPYVPATIDGDDETQFVYAIDAGDGSVMVLENGRLVSVNSGAVRPDRIAFNTNAAATALEVITPAFDPRQGAQQWLEPDLCPEQLQQVQNPASLRGVFLSAVLTDGTIRIVDVHDMELRSCRSCPDAPIPVLARHQQRIAVTFAGDGQQTPSLAPQTTALLFVEDGVPFGIRANGTTGSPQAPGLACMACAEGLVQAFPSRADEDDDDDLPGAGDADAGVDGAPQTGDGCNARAPALVCANPDPWSVGGQGWFAVFEGLIPGTQGKLGRFVAEGSAESVSGALEFHVAGASESDEIATTLDFCSAGVLGEDDIAASYADPACAEGADGDQLVITAPLLTDERLEQKRDQLGETAGAIIERCGTIRDELARQDRDTAPLGFEIRRAFRDRLVLSNRLAHPIGGARTFADVEPCLESGLIAFDVRALNQFSVFGAQAGALHRVRTSSAGRCVVDTSADPLRQMRARLGCTYQNGLIQFQIRNPNLDQNELPPPPLLEFRVQADTPAVKLFVNANIAAGAGVIGVQMRWNPIDGQLYVVDVHGRGVMPLPVDPLPVVPPLSYN